MWRIAILSLCFTLTACDPFPQVEKEDTIEAYEAYLKEHKDSTYELQAKTRLEELYLEEAREQQTLEAYDRYLKRWPSGVFKTKALGERQSMLLQWAERDHTPESYKKFLDEYPTADKRIKKKIRKAMHASKFVDQLAIGEARIERVNLAEDPEGPMNGWGIWADVTNNTDRSLSYLQLTVFYLDEKGEVIGQDRWPAVAPSYGVPMEEEKKVPIKPGETRTWEWTTGDIPETWSKGVTLRASALTFKDAQRRTAGQQE